MSVTTHEVRALIESPSAVEKAERIRSIIVQAEARGLRADPDIDDADLLAGLEFRIVSVFFLKRVLQALQADAEGYVALMQAVQKIVADTGYDLQALLPSPTDPADPTDPTHPMQGER
jgi:hypothetical protein